MVNRFKSLVWQVQVQQDRQAASGNRVPVPPSQHEDGGGRGHCGHDHNAGRLGQGAFCWSRPLRTRPVQGEFFPFPSRPTSSPPSVISFLPIF